MKQGPSIPTWDKGGAVQMVNRVQPQTQKALPDYALLAYAKILHRIAAKKQQREIAHAA